MNLRSNIVCRRRQNRRSLLVVGERVLIRTSFSIIRSISIVSGTTATISSLKSWLLFVDYVPVPVRMMMMMIIVRIVAAAAAAVTNVIIAAVFWFQGVPSTGHQRLRRGTSFVFLSIAITSFRVVLW